MAGMKKAQPRSKKPGFASKVQFTPATGSAVDAWAKQNGVANRTEAIRRLVEIGLYSCWVASPHDG